MGHRVSDAGGCLHNSIWSPNFSMRDCTARDRASVLLPRSGCSVTQVNGHQQDRRLPDVGLLQPLASAQA